jgi:hypothetical protein
MNRIELSQEQEKQYEKYLFIFGMKFKTLAQIAVVSDIDNRQALKKLGQLIDKNKKRR